MFCDRGRGRGGFLGEVAFELGLEGLEELGVRGLHLEHSVLYERGHLGD